MIGADCSELGSDEGDGGDGSGLESHGTGDLEEAFVSISILVLHAGSPGVGNGGSGFTVAVLGSESLDLEVLGCALDGLGGTTFGVAAIIVELVHISLLEFIGKLFAFSLKLLCAVLVFESSGGDASLASVGDSGRGGTGGESDKCEFHIFVLCKQLIIIYFLSSLFA